MICLYILIIISIFVIRLRIVQNLEMNKKRNYIYRFKTKNEFINEYGSGWRNIRCGFIEQMDYLLGQVIENTLNDFTKKFVYDEIDIVFDKKNDTDFFNFYNSIKKYYNISENMIIKKNTKPTYEPKIFIR